MQNKQPLVSIISINWNSLSVTKAFLQSIRDHNTYSNLEIIIVDNHSKEDPTSELLSEFPEVKLIRSKRNLGFSGGNNLGMQYANGSFYFIVNNDTEFTPGLIEGLLEIFETHPDAGAASPKFHYFYEKGTIEYAGFEAINIFTGRNGMVGSREKDYGQYDQVCVTPYAHGGGMMVPARVVEEVGPMNEIFFLYYEELDWSNQIKKKGYHIYYQPGSLIYHKESMSTGKSSPLKTFYLTRNRILFMRRNVPAWGLTVFLLYFIFFTIPKNTIQYLIQRQKEHLLSFWRGIFWHFNPKIDLKP